jgi:hypothetical protein
MKKAGLIFGIVGAFLSGSAGAAELPAGPNRDIVERACGACHDFEMIYAAAGQTRDGWNGIIEEMTRYGLRVSPVERLQILEYLASFLGPEAPTTR